MKRILFFVVLIFLCCFIGCNDKTPPIEKVRDVFPNCKIMELNKNSRTFVAICPDNKFWYIENMSTFNNEITNIRKIEEISK